RSSDSTFSLGDIFIDILINTSYSIQEMLANAFVLNTGLGKNVVGILNQDGFNYANLNNETLNADIVWQAYVLNISPIAFGIYITTSVMVLLISVITCP